MSRRGVGDDRQGAGGAMPDRRVLDDIVRRIVAVARSERIVLFGSVLGWSPCPDCAILWEMSRMWEVNMPWKRMSTIVLLSSFLVSAPAVRAEVLRGHSGLFEVLMNKECSPSCVIEPGNGQAPFELSYTITEKDGSYAVVLTLGTTTFHLEVGLPEIIDDVLPFYRYRFVREHVHRLYRLRELNTASNYYSHFFVRDAAGEFHYLGSYGDLSYDTDERLFVALEPRGAPNRLSYYKLDGNRFLCQKGQCAGTKPDAGF